MIVAKHKIDGTHEDSHEEGSAPPALLAAIQDFIGAVHAKDAEAAAAAFEDAYETLASSAPEDDEQGEE